jgi:hypothetical protein
MKLEITTLPTGSGFPILSVISNSTWNNWSPICFNFWYDSSFKRFATFRCFPISCNLSAKSINSSSMK